MRVSLIQVDGKHINLPLMKLSTHLKNKGHEVVKGGYGDGFDKVYMSVVFPENLSKARQMGTMFPNTEIIIGGTGIDIEKCLPYEIEHSKPDYELFNCDYSVGFTSRGCFRRCPFCIVWRKEGDKVIEWSPFEEFVDDSQDRIILYDGQFLGSPLHIQKLKWLRDGRYRVSFNQGLDLRLVTEEIAGLLKDIRAVSFSGKGTQYYFAWDFIKDEDEILRGLYLLKDAGINPYSFIIYILTGYNSTIEEDQERINKILKFGSQPYAMRYNNSNDKLLRDQQRWTNRRLYKYITFEEYLKELKEKRR